MENEIKEMYAALAGISTSDMSGVEATTANGYCHVDFNRNSDEVELRNAAKLLVHNIALLKDHLKVWCSENGATFGGEDLINRNRSVAIVHDLWNVQKHRKLTSKPRSGIIPELRNFQTVLSLGAPNGPVSVILNPGTGQIIGTGAALTLYADVFDEKGGRVGIFPEICREAVDAWHQELLSVGVTIPK